MADVMLFNSIFSDCSEGYPEVALKGMRMGYPTNFWADLGEEVCAYRSLDLQDSGSEGLSFHAASAESVACVLSCKDCHQCRQRLSGFH